MYVLLIMIPVMVSSIALLDLTVTDYKITNNLVRKEQAFYNSAAGIKDAVKRFNTLTYTWYRETVYYLDFNGDNVVFSITAPASDNYVKIKISYTNLLDGKSYTVEANGNYLGYMRRNTEVFISK